MKTFYTILVSTLLFMCCTSASADVTYSTATIPAANIAQGSSNIILYAVKLDVTVSPVTVNRIQFTLTGTHDNDDMTTLNVYYNPTGATLAGASYMVIGSPANFAAPHTYDLSFNYSGSQTIAAGGSGYFIITASISNTATNGNTIKVDGAANPVGFTYTAPPTIVNNQTNVAGTQTIQAANITYTTISSPAATVAQGSSNNIVYIVKVDVTGAAVTMNRIQFTLTGTHDNDDLTLLNVYYNATAPTVAGSSTMAYNNPATFAAPHAYDISFNYSGSQTINAGSSGYFIIVASVSNTATTGNTVKADGAANPVTFTYTTAPTVTNSQTNLAGAQTIQAAGVTFSTISSPAANVQQGSANNIVYIVKADVTGQSLTVNHIQFTLSGTYDADDLTTINVYFNPTTPTLSGSSLMAYGIPATFAAPHAYDEFFNYAGLQVLAAGSSGYFIIVVSVSNTATNGNTFKIDGAANPVTFSYTTAPVITNNQTNLAGIQTILAGVINFTTVSSPAANVIQGSTNNIVYIVKADVTVEPVTLNYIQFTLSGSYDADDLSTINLYYNPTTPTLSGASTLAVGIPATFAAPHAYNFFFNYAGMQTINPGASGYFIIVASVSSTGTNGNTFKVDGAANPATFSYTTAPTVTTNQTNISGTQTIVAGVVALSSVSVPAQNIAQASNYNILYIVKADVTAEPVTFTHMQFTLNGTMDNDDITGLNIYYNPTAPTLSGASTLALNLPANFAAPHAYDEFFNYAGMQTINPGSSGYFILTASVSTTGTAGNTIKVDGAAQPVTFTYNLAPTFTSSQTDVAGIQTIQAVGITLSTPTLAPTALTQGSTNNILYVVKADVTSLPVTISRIQFTITGTIDNNDLTFLNIYYNPTAPTISGGTTLAINNPATFAAPHSYDLNFNYSGNQTIAAGASGYFIIAANVDPTATVGNTVKINGAANPVTFTYSTGPTITNNQTDAAGAGTIGNVVPLVLADFNGYRSDPKTISLVWTTASEANSKEFDVQWSEDGRSFTGIATLPAANYSTQPRQYNYIDNGRVNPDNYYRLKSVDNDGRFTYSRIIKIAALPAIGEISAFPNPFINNLQLQVQSVQNKTVELNLTDAVGKRIVSKSLSLIKGNNLINWDLPNLAAGNYFISSSGGEFKTVEVRRQ